MHRFASNLPAYLFSFAALCILLVACDDRPTPTPPVRTESDQQVKKLREDNELEFNDLRGRWLAAKGELLRLRSELTDAEQDNSDKQERLVSRIDQIESSLTLLTIDIESLRNRSTPARPVDDELERLARSYEEIHCLRRQGAEDAIAEVYARYGFEDLEQWARAWTRAARSEAFERQVNARVERLCP